MHKTVMFESLKKGKIEEKNYLNSEVSLVGTIFYLDQVEARTSRYVFSSLISTRTSVGTKTSEVDP